MIATLATGGVLISTTVVGLVTHLILRQLGLELPLIYCLLFGALISPTDPIAVGAILRRVGLQPSLLTKVSGESLFNDGVGVVLFLVLIGDRDGRARRQRGERVAAPGAGSRGRSCVRDAARMGGLPDAQVGRQLPGRNSPHAGARDRRVRRRPPAPHFPGRWRWLSRAS